MLISLTGNAFAIDINREIVVSESVIFETKASKIPHAVKNVLIEKGAVIADNTSVKVLSINNSNDSVICVTNNSNGLIENDIIISYNKNADGELVINNTIPNAITNSGTVWGSATYNGYDSDFTVIGKLYSTEYVGPYGVLYYRPYQCDFTYTKGTNVTVGLIEVYYITEGVLYTYPGYEQLESPYAHTVTVSILNPAPNTTYSNVNYLPINRAIKTSSGTLNAGHALSFNCYVNGRNEHYTVNITELNPV